MVAMTTGNMLNNEFCSRQNNIVPESSHFLRNVHRCNMDVSRADMSRESARARAIGMIEAGRNQREVAECLSITRRTVNKWWRRFVQGQSLKDRPRPGRPSNVSRVAKIVCAKAVNKRGQSVRKLSNKLSRKGYRISKTTVQRYMKQSLGLKAYRRPQQPKISEKQQKKRVEFCKTLENWTVQDFEQVIWSDESMFEIEHTSNPQNDRVWAKEKTSVPPRLVSKHPAKIMVWGAMSALGLTELHVVPQKQTVDTQYYTREILENSLLPSLARTASTGSVLEKKMVPGMSPAIFQQDGAPAHMSNEAQNWCQEKLPSFWGKSTWPGNSPDLNPIENLWGILKAELAETEPCSSTEQLTALLKSAWANIKLSTLRNLVASMPQRVSKCLALKGEHIGQ